MSKVKLTKIAYEPHPVSLERKRELNAKGYKILDARFAPVDVANPEADDGRIDLGTDSGAGFSDDELRKIIEQETGEKVHHRTGREKLVERFNELNAAAAE